VYTPAPLIDCELASITSPPVDISPFGAEIAVPDPETESVPVTAAVFNPSDSVDEPFPAEFEAPNRR
jgi:hypothetical protein